MKKLRSEIPHPAKQFRHVVQQTLGAVQLADPQREGPKTSAFDLMMTSLQRISGA